MKRSVFAILAALFVNGSAFSMPPVPEVASSTIGYKSVAEALAALRAQPITESEQQGWVIFNDPVHTTIWSFAPQDNAAYPSAVKRQMIQKDGAWLINMSVQCEASKKACDQLVRDFQRLNQQMREAIQSSHDAQNH
jgi:hypothetical protein